MSALPLFLAFFSKFQHRSLVLHSMWMRAVCVKSVCFLLACQLSEPLLACISSSLLFFSLLSLLVEVLSTLNVAPNKQNKDEWKSPPSLPYFCCNVFVFPCSPFTFAVQVQFPIFSFFFLTFVSCFKIMRVTGFPLKNYRKIIYLILLQHGHMIEKVEPRCLIIDRGYLGKERAVPNCFHIILYHFICFIFSWERECICNSSMVSWKLQSKRGLSPCFPKSIDPKLALKFNLSSFFPFLFPYMFQGKHVGTHPSRKIFIYTLEVHAAFVCKISTTTWPHLRFSFVARIPLRSQESLFTDLLLPSLLQSFLSNSPPTGKSSSL